MVAATGSGLRNARPALSVTLGSRPPSERSGFLLPIADRGIHFAARALRNSPENRHTKLFALLAPMPLGKANNLQQELALTRVVFC